MEADRLLRIALIAVGLVFVFGVYPQPILAALGR